LNPSDPIIVTQGSNTQTFTVYVQALVGATSVTVGTFTANAAYTTGASILRSDRRIVYLKSVRQLPLPGTFAARIKVSGPVGTTSSLAKIVKAFYGFGGIYGAPGQTQNSQNIEHDFEFCIEPNHPFLGSFPNTPIPCLLNTSYADASGASWARPCGPTYVGDIINDWITCVFSVSIYAQTSTTITYKSDYYMLHARSLPNYIFLGSTYLPSDITTTWERAQFDIHYMNTSLTAGNPHSMSVLWFYYSPIPGDLPSPGY
jgi:hypothetical protein